MDVLREVEHRLAFAVELRLLDRVIHDLGDDDARRRWRVRVHAVKPAKRQERFLEWVVAGDAGAVRPRNVHLPGGRLAKRKLVPVCAKRLHRLGRLAVDEQVGRVYAIHWHAELDLHRLQRLHCQPRGRIGASDMRWVVVGEGVRPAVPGGGCLERIGRKRLVGDPVILHPRQLNLAVRQWPRLEHPRPSPAGHGQRRLAIDQQVGGIDSLNRFVEIYRDLLEVRRQSARGQGGGDRRRDALVRHHTQFALEHDVRTRAALVQHDDGKRVFAVLQHRLEVLDLVVAEPQRLRRRTGGLAAVPRFFRGDVVSGHLDAVDVGHEAVVHLCAERG